MSGEHNAGGPSHSAQSSISQVDSTASTLLASPSTTQSVSFEKSRAHESFKARTNDQSLKQSKDDDDFDALRRESSEDDDGNSGTRAGFKPRQYGQGREQSRDDDAYGLEDKDSGDDDDDEEADRVVGRNAAALNGSTKLSSAEKSQARLVSKTQRHGQGRGKSKDGDDAYGLEKEGFEDDGDDAGRVFGRDAAALNASTKLLSSSEGARARVGSKAQMDAQGIELARGEKGAYGLEKEETEDDDEEADRLLGRDAAALKRRAKLSSSLEKSRAGAGFRARQNDGSLGEAKDVDDDDVYDSKKEDSEDGDEEADHLLGRDAAALNERPAAAVATHPEDEPAVAPVKEKARPISWSELPKKGQLAILTLARLSEPLTQQGLQSYMFYQLKSFTLPNGEAPSDSTVASQAGILAASFTGAQFLTAFMWGRLADWEGLGRKRVILIGLLGTAVGSLGFGFSRSFAAAVFWRCLGGMLNGNIGVMRTMISEIVREKKYQSRAFLLMPMCFNIGVIIGPLLGGWLADPVGSYPQTFGPGGSIGGKDGVGWLMRFPYALPNVVNACFLVGSALGILFGLEETLEALRDKPDYPLRFSRWVLRVCTGSRQSHGYAALAGDVVACEAGDVELQAAARDEVERPRVRRQLPFRRIWTRNVVLTFIAHGMLAMHVGTFNNLWFVFLSTPRFDPSASSGEDRDRPSLTLPPGYRPHVPFTFTGGLALPPPSIGTALAILGVIGITMQLLLFPTVSFKLGTTRSFRWSLLLFPVSYFLAPYLAIVPSSSSPPEQASGALVWLGITLVLTVQVTARTFALPSTAILVNNCCPHPSVLGSVHGVAQSVSSLTRTVGPVLAGWLYGAGLNRGVVGLAWWCICVVAVVGAVAGRFVREGSGHDIMLDGEDDEGQGGRVARK